MLGVMEVSEALGRMGGAGFMVASSHKTLLELQKHFPEDGLKNILAFPVHNMSGQPDAIEMMRVSKSKRVETRDEDDDFKRITQSAKFVFLVLSVDLPGIVPGRTRKTHGLVDFFHMEVAAESSATQFNGNQNCLAATARGGQCLIINATEAACLLDAMYALDQDIYSDPMMLIHVIELPRLCLFRQPLVSVLSRHAQRQLPFFPVE